MSAAVIESLSTKLFRLLQAYYFSRDSWASNLKPTGSVCSEFQGIFNILVEINPYSMVDLHDYLPSDNQKCIL